MATDETDNKGGAESGGAISRIDSFAISDSISQRYANLLEKLLEPESPLNLEYLLDLLVGLAFENDSRDKLGNLVENSEEIFSMMVDRISINDFKIIRKLGSGAFGVVYLVMEKSSHNYFALKRSEKEDIDPTDQSFITEKRIMMKSKSPWMPSCYYCFHNTRYIYYAMELFAGGTIEDLIEVYYPIKEDQCKNIAAQMILGANATHELGYIHRDIKPENYLITADGRIKIGDFGLAKPLDEAGEWYTRIPAGTPSYMSPELFESIKNSTVRNFTLATDYWSLGTSIFEIYYGCSLYEDDDENNIDIQALVLNHDPQNISFNPLEDPEAPLFSDDFKELLIGLLEAEEKRFLYKDCKKSKFFSGVDFDNLHKETPVIVPPLNSKLFDENTSDIKEFQTTRKKVLYTGKNLLFSGFTEGKGNIIQHSLNKVIGNTSKGPSADVINAQLSQIQQELETTKQKYSDAINDLQTEIDSKNKTADELKSVRLLLIEQESISKSFESKIESFGAESDSLKTEIDKLKHAKSTNEQSIEELHAIIKAKEKEKFDISNKLATNEASIVALRLKIDDMNANLALAETEKNKLNEKVAESMRKISTQQSVEASLASLSSSEKKHIDKISELEIEIMMLNSKVENLDKELEDKTNLSNKLHSKSVESDEALTNTKFELNSVKQQVEATEQELEEKNKKIDALKVENEEAVANYEKSNGELKKTNENIAVLQNQISTKDKLMEQRAQELEELSTKLEESLKVSKKVFKYRQQRDEMSEKYTTTKKTLESATQNNASLLNNIQEVNNEKTKMKSEYEDKIYKMQNDISSLTQQQQQLLGFVNQLGDQGKLDSSKSGKSRANTEATRKLENKKKQLENEISELRTANEKLKTNYSEAKEEISNVNRAWKKKVEAKDQINLMLRRKIELLGGNVDSLDLGDDGSVISDASQNNQTAKPTAISKKQADHVKKEQMSDEQIKNMLSPYINAFKENSNTVFHIDYNVLSTNVRCPPSVKGTLSRSNKIEKWPQCNLIFDIKCRTVIFREPTKQPLEYEISNTVGILPASEHTKAIPKAHLDKALLIFFGTGKIINRDIAVPTSVIRSEPIKNLTHSQAPTKFHLLPENQSRQHHWHTSRVITPYIKCAYCNKYVTTSTEKDVIASKCKTCDICVHKHHEKEPDFKQKLYKCVVTDLKKVVVFDSASEKDNWMKLIRDAHSIPAIDFN